VAALTPVEASAVAVNAIVTAMYRMCSLRMLDLLGGKCVGPA
jgi:hypothetical protein